MTVRLYVDLPPGELAAGRTVALPDAAAHHALRVLRMRDGEPVTLFDGSGGEWRAMLAVSGRRGAQARVEAHDPVERESPLAVTLALATIASEAMDSALRKAVELGAAAIAPMIAARSQRAPRGASRPDHWRRIAIAACEQCGRNRVPPIADPLPLADWLPARTAGRAGVVLVPGAPRSLASIAIDGPIDRPIDLAIGPEGGWTPEEARLLERSGFAAASMGPRILRAETAAVSALAILLSAGGGLR
ncbi:MAG: 16S rRNA (uracil(1498)-N(3))-methyltransferase [Burkholderiales bacterium]